MHNDCIFCKIVAGELPASIVYQGVHVIGFKDIDPAAPVHIVFIPKRHITSMNDVSEEDCALFAEMLCAVPRVAREQSISQSGYQMIVRTGKDGNQEVMHMHLNLLGGKPLA